MKTRIVLLFFCYISTLNAAVSGFSSKCFRAAVYEAVTIGGHFRCAQQEICESLKIYKYVIGEAARLGAQIIVFPEHGLFPPYDRNKTHHYLEVIPNKMKHFNPCNQKRKFSKQPIQIALSCAAKRYRIYVVANMGEVEYCRRSTGGCHKDGRFQYNVVVAFDENGYLVAKYRKYHLYYEDDHFDYPEKQEFTYFDTPFGRIGVFICFDALFKEPAISLIEKHNVTTLALPTWWFNETPFLVGHEFQQSIAIGNNINLLAANANDLILGTTGSGIYNGKRGALIYTYQDNQRRATLMVTTLSVDARDTSSNCIPNKQINQIDVLKYAPGLSDTSYEVDKYKVPPLDINLFVRSKLNKNRDTIKLCKHNFCCQLSYIANGDTVNSNGQNYYFSVVNGIREKWCEQICALFAFDDRSNTYLSTNGSKFHYFTITANFKTKYIYPSVISNNLELVPTNQWNFSKNNNYAMLQVRNAVNLISAALYARCYDNDPTFP